MENNSSLDKITIIPINDMEAVYILDESGNVSFSLLPEGTTVTNYASFRPDPLVQLSVLGDATIPGFAAGETRHNSSMTMSMSYEGQFVDETDEGKVITTIVSSPDGISAKHIVVGSKKSRGIRVYTRLQNQSDEDVMIEAVSSVNISDITPFAEDEGRDRLFLHRFRSRWSEEGRHEIRSVEDLLLEPSWANFGVRCEKFGCIGSMPVRGFFPFAAIEDREEGIFWGVSLACSSSWQMEAVRIDKGLSLSAGLADYDYGHWRKIIKPGDDFITPEAYVTVVKGDFTTMCDRLLDVQKDKLLEHQRVEKLSAIFNEYCTTWGEPGEEVIRRLLSVISGEDFDYFVIDAGWYADSIKGWQDNMGDWNVAENLFPNGIKKVVDMINEAGMKAGIWFELEVVGKASDKVDDTAHLLTRDGKVVISGTRKFWDMRSEWVESYLTEKVINFLRDNGFSYIKIDYNDTIGIGCDGAESVGEGLRACINATKAFFRKIRENVPGIAIEVCSSGGHRLEPGFMELADYLSFSDAHEEKEIPVIAADLQNLVLAQKSQIWAVLRKDDPLKRIMYSVCAAMYGVLCISGDVFDLSQEKWELAREGVKFYKKVSPIIINGVTERFGPFQKSNRNLQGYQAGVRRGKNGQTLVLVHSFAHEGKQEISIPVSGNLKIMEIFEQGNHLVRVEDQNLKLTFDETFDAVAVLLQDV